MVIAELASEMPKRGLLKAVTTHDVHAKVCHKSMYLTHFAYPCQCKIAFTHKPSVVRENWGNYSGFHACPHSSLPKKNEMSKWQSLR